MNKTELLRSVCYQCRIFVVILFVVPFVNKLVSFQSEVIFFFVGVVIHDKQLSRLWHCLKNAMSSICRSSMNISIKKHIVTTVIGKIVWYSESSNESMMSVYHQHAFCMWSCIEIADSRFKLFVSCVESMNECFCCIQRVSSFLFADYAVVNHIFKRLLAKVSFRNTTESVNKRIPGRVQCAEFRIFHEFILIKKRSRLSHTWQRASEQWSEVGEVECCDRCEWIFFSTVQLTIVNHLIYLHKVKNQKRCLINTRSVSTQYLVLSSK